MKKLLLLFLSFCLIGALYSQSPRLYSTSQGLVSTRINQVACDKDNFLWITTSQGLCRFDGQSFSTYQKQAGNPYALQENNVSCIYEDKNGKHWIGAADGLYYLCRTENRLTHYVLDSAVTNISVSNIVPHPLNDNLLIISTYGYGIRVFNKATEQVERQMTGMLCFMLKRFNIQHMTGDAHNHLWIANPDGLQCIDLEKMALVTLPEFITQQPIVIQDILEDFRHDRLYFATVNKGLICCDLGTMNFKQVNMPNLNNSNLTALTLSPEGDLIVGTESEGLWRIHLGQATRIQVEDCPVDLDHVKVHSITYDDQRNLWLGLYQKGLLFIPNQQRLFKNRPIRPTGSIHNLGSISSFAVMSDGSKLYGIDGAGVIIENTDGTTTHFNTSNSELNTNSVLSVVALPNRHAFIGTYNYGVYFFDGKEIKRDPMLSLLDKQSIMTMANDTLTRTLYIGTNGDGIYAYRPRAQQLRRLSGERHLLWIVSLAMDRRHRLWASTEGSIICFDIDQEERRIIPPYSTPVRAYGIAEDNNGTIWFGTDHGLLTFGAGSDSLKLVEPEGEKLTEDYFSLLQSKDGRLWMPSSNGLVCYDPHSKSVSRYFDPEIANVGSFSIRAATMWKDGTLSFGGDNGIVEFSPEEVIAYHRSLRPIQFTKLWVNNLQNDYDPTLSAEENILDESLWKASRMHLPYSSNSFALSFSVQEYANPLGIRYFYQLKGFDKDWHEVLGLDKTAIYSSLPWGEFTLEVKAVLREANGEIQTVTKELKVEIDAPWWASWWAILLYAIILFLSIGAIIKSLRIRAHQRNLVRRAEHNRQIKEAKLRMFTSVSHEIMTPLTLIISPLRRLMQRNNDNATQSVYEMMYRSCLRILMLVTQQMDIRKIDNGQLRLHVLETPLRGFLDDIMQYFSNNALQRQIDFQLIIPDDKREITVWIDPDQLDKVFFNLLSNAFKFVNNNGKVHIKVAIAERNQELTIEVYNSGSHIDADMEHLFERFGTEGGESLGLSLANELTAMHHGKLSARNEEDGVTMIVTLPLGDQLFTDEEKKPIRRVRRTEQESLALEAHAIHEENTEPSTGKDLIEMLSDELHEKQRLRERRSSLSFNFQDKELSSADERLLNRVADCISKNLGDPDFTVDELADQVGISRVHLNRKLKELIDTSPSSLIKNTRLKQAAFLLVQNNVTIAEVAYSVGFSSPAYFSSNFSAYFGMTPKEFVNTYTEDPNNPELQKLLE